MRRKGFTLVEVLVILAILAALAAVLVPTVSNQIRKSDVGRVTGDLTNLRTGVEAFLVNVHRYPGDVEDLVLPIQTDGSDTDIEAQNYPGGLASRWEGPYIDRVIEAGGTLETGFGAAIQDGFVATNLDIDADGTPDDVEFLTVIIEDMATPEFDLVDAEIDEGNGADEGRFRYITGTPDVVHFYALPIN